MRNPIMAVMGIMGSYGGCLWSHGLRMVSYGVSWYAIMGVPIWMSIYLLYHYILWSYVIQEISV